MGRSVDTLVMGAVAYDAKVVIIWEGFRDWFRSQGLDFDYVLYSNYERQVEALMTGDIDVAWNSPLAWVRSERLAAAQGRTVAAVAMRDTDCDLTSVVVVASGSAIDTAAGLAGRTVGVGAVDSPQATLIPLGHLQSLGLVPGRDFHVRRHDVAVGKHGDHVGGERDAAQALMAGEVDAACMTDGNHLLFATEGTLPPGSTRVLVQTPVYDHCNFTALSSSPPPPPPPSVLLGRFKALLLAMSYDDPSVRPLLDLEGLTQWREGRTTGYLPLETAVTGQGFYDDEGQVNVADYRP
ncbi:MAG: phosphate/phosphite/phosphonate ABC transporter substrate-binding protein [Actinomycetota bacterium]|nr:phosphate/phosphite/phosphonate ABC transporter substrate-binding protein [Actinomycetota bacterium]